MFNSRRSILSWMAVFRVLCERPLATLNQVCERTGLSFPAVAKSMGTLENLGIVREVTGQRRNRLFAYQNYLDILNEGTEML